ncbi:MAG: hypothetical protein JW703_03860 [Candidatus Diapherotrites archaeon]|nr:hypothetical protein [Candidatus Diapherotrites archaeon]
MDETNSVLESEEINSTENSVHLVKKGLKVNISRQKVLDSVKEYVNSFGWSEFKYKKLDRLNLFMIPFYLFHFDIFKSVKEGDKEKILDQTSGVLSLDAARNKLDAQVARFFGHHEAVEKIELTDDSPEYKILDSNITFDKAEEIIKIKLASQFNIPRDNVIISGNELLFIPIYFTEIELNSETFVLKINGFDGKLFSDKLIPARKKELNQLFNETIDDLQHPNKWVEYSAGSLSSAVHANSGILFQFVVLVLVLIIIAVLLIFAGII